MAEETGGPLPPYAAYVLPATFATSSALVGTFSVVLAKVMSELLALQMTAGSNDDGGDGSESSGGSGGDEAEEGGNSHSDSSNGGGGESSPFVGEDSWFSYVTIIGWICFAGAWLYRMNEALSLCESRQLVVVAGHHPVSRSQSIERAAGAALYDSLSPSTFR